MGRTYIKARAGAFAIAGTLAVTGVCGVHAQGIPTGGAPSPTGNAQPWSQQMMRFEEFGTKPMVGTGCSTCTPVPPPQNCTLGPQSASIDTFLKQALKTAPTRLALTTGANPWELAVEGCLGNSLAQTFAEGSSNGRVVCSSALVRVCAQGLFPDGAGRCTQERGPS
jgi:hypothetical protein